MADNGTAVTAPQPVSAPAPAAGQPAQAPAAPSFDPAEYQRLQRIEQQWKGSQPLIEKARHWGFEKPESFDTLGPAIKAIRDGGHNPADIAKVFGKAVEANPEQSDSMTKAGMESWLGEKLTQREFERAKKDHERGMSADLAELTEDKLNVLLGDDLPKSFKKLAPDLASAYWMRSRQAFPDDHPLKGNFQPMGKEAIASGVPKYLKEAYASIKSELEAARAVETGKAALKRAPSTPAGAPAGSGPPTTSASGSPDARREKLEAIAASTLAKRR